MMQVWLKTRESMLRTFAVVAIAIAVWTCAYADDARPYPEADRLFRSDARWLGGDDVGSIELSPGRILWLFDDSFVAPSPPFTRTKASFVRNSVAVQDGSDPRSARITFTWRGDERPTSFFADARDHWYWAGGGIRMPTGPLLILLRKITATPNQGLGFAVTGFALARIGNPDDTANDWRVEILDQKTPPFDALPSSAVILEPPYIVVLALRQQGTHAGMLVRYDAQAFARGDLSQPQWWMGKRLAWQTPRAMGANRPAEIMHDAGAESSIHWDARARRYVHVASYGFGATTIGVRTAAKLTGPWSAPRMAYRPPESSGTKPFVYAGKAHPELAAPGNGLVISYVANSFDVQALMTPAGQRNLYWPRFAILPRAAEPTHPSSSKKSPE